MAFLGAPARGEDLPPVTVTDTRLEAEEGAASPGCVTILRPEEVRGEAKTVADLLEQSAGVHVVRLRGRGNYTVALVRGSTAAQVAVYLDGTLVNSAGESAVDLSTLPVESVERIEVYRGAIPARFGVSGAGAVISILTRRPRGREGSVLVQGGSYGEWGLSGRYGNDLGDGRYLVSFGFSGSQGDFSYHNDNGTPWNPSDDYDATRQNNDWTEGNLLFRYQGDDGWRFRAEAYRRDQDLPRKASGNDRPGDPPGSNLDTRRLRLAAGKEGSWEGGSWSWDLTYGRLEKEFFDPLDPRTLPTPRSTRNEYDTDLWDLSGGATLTPWKGHRVDLNLRLAHEALSVRGDYVDRYHMKGDYTQNATDFTAEDRIDLGGGTVLVPTLRWNRVDDESHLSGGLALEGRFSSSLGWHASWGVYHRAPNLYERYGDGALILPRPDLEWERSVQWDAGLRWSGTVAGGRTTLDVSYFQADAEDLIEFVMAGPYVGYYDNIGKSFVRGAEVEATYARDTWDAVLAYTYTDGENRTPGGNYGKPLPNRPKHAATLRVNGDLLPRLRGFLEVEYLGENWVDAGANLAYEDLTTVGLGIKWSLREGGVLTLGVRDLFDQSSDRKNLPTYGPPELAWYPDPGRTFYASYLWTF